MARKQRVLTDHDQIREWAEERSAAPSCVRGTGGRGDTGMLRLDFPGYSGEDSLEHIDWADWFEKFDEKKLALLVEDETAGGQRSNFNKLVSRATATSMGTKRKSVAKKSARGGAKKSAGRKVAGKKAAGKKAAGKKAAGKKASGKKTAGRKAAAKKSARAGRRR